jgi:hypothetical protein
LRLVLATRPAPDIKWLGFYHPLVKAARFQRAIARQ